MALETKDFKLNLPLNVNGSSVTTPRRQKFIDLHKVKKQILAKPGEDDKVFQASNLDKDKSRSADNNKVEEAFDEAKHNDLKSRIAAHEDEHEGLEKKAAAKKVSTNSLPLARKHLDLAHRFTNYGQYGSAEENLKHARTHLDTAARHIRKGPVAEAYKTGVTIVGRKPNPDSVQHNDNRDKKKEPYKTGVTVTTKADKGKSNVVQMHRAANDPGKKSHAPKLGGMTDNDRLLPRNDKPKTSLRDKFKALRKYVGHKIAGEETQIDEKLTAKDRSTIVKKAEHGKKIFGGHFNQVEKKAEKEYGSAEAGRKVAAAIMWKKLAKTHKESTDVDDYNDAVNKRKAQDAYRKAERNHMNKWNHHRDEAANAVAKKDKATAKFHFKQARVHSKHADAIDKEYHSKYGKHLDEEVEQTDEAHTPDQLKAAVSRHQFGRLVSKWEGKKRKVDQHNKAIQKADDLHYKKTGKRLTDTDDFVESEKVNELNSANTLKVKYQYHDKKEVEHGRNWVNHPKNEKEMRKSDMHGKARDIAKAMYKKKTGRDIDENRLDLSVRLNRIREQLDLITEKPKPSADVENFDSPDAAKAAGAKYFQMSKKLAKEDPEQAKHYAYLAQKAYARNQELKKQYSGVGDTEGEE